MFLENEKDNPLYEFSSCQVLGLVSSKLNGMNGIVINVAFGEKIRKKRKIMVFQRQLMLKWIR